MSLSALSLLLLLLLLLSYDARDCGALVLVILVTQMKPHLVSVRIKKILRHIIRVNGKFALMLIHDSSFCMAHPRQVTPNFVLKKRRKHLRIAMMCSVSKMKCANTHMQMQSGREREVCLH